MSVNETTELKQQTERRSAPEADPGHGDIFAPPASAPAADGATPGEKVREVRQAEFSTLEPRPATGPTGSIGRLMDVVVSMTIELGSTQLPLREVLDLGPGSVVKLDRVLGEPVDILINRELVGRGEVVVIDERFGVRVTQLVSPGPEKK